MDGSISTSVSTVRSVHQHFPTSNSNSGESSTSHLHKERDQLQRSSGSSADVHDQSDGNDGGLSETLRETEYALNSVGGTSTGAAGASIPASPRMPLSTHALVLPSPPDSPGPSRSPSIASVSESSLPSVSSSFFFSSSAPGSPGRSHPSSYPSSHPHSDHEHEHGEGSYPRAGEETLVIPSLPMPDALRRPTPFGQTLGNLRVLVLGGQGAGKSFLTGLLLEDNEDVVDVGTWEDWNGGTDAYGKVLRASTDWLEQRDMDVGMYGLERYEPTRNVEIVELPGYSHDADVQELITRLKAVIEAPFRALHDVLHPDTQPSATVATMLAAPTSPLYTALIFLLPSPPTPLDKEIIHALSTDIPLIVLPRLSGPHRALGSGSAHSAKLSAFRPASAVALRSGLFHSPETVALLRREAVDRFMRWREVERAVEGVWEGSGQRERERVGTAAARDFASRSSFHDHGGDHIHDDAFAEDRWSKTKWEAEWMGNYSRDVAVRMRQGTVTDRKNKSRRRRSVGAASSLSNFDADGRASEYSSHSHSHPQPHDRPHDTDRHPPHTPTPTHTPFDPLHLPSLLMFSLSLLGPLRSKLGETVWGFVELFVDTRVQIVVAGGFCVGVGVGTWGRGW